MFDVIERLKSEWTDRYVVVNSSAPELARFVNSTGTVRTVNMNGRCLVEFDQFNNTGWYDIDPSALKIVPQPLPKTVEKEAAKPSTSAKAAPAKAAPAAKAAPKPAGAGKPSTADILAAARAKAGGTAAPAAAKPAPAAKPPAAKPQAAPVAVSGGKLSTAEILARARAAKAGAAPPVSPATPAVDEEGDESEPTVVEAAPAKPAAAKKPAAAGGPAPTTTAEKIAWCREHDAPS